MASKNTDTKDPFWEQQAEIFKKQLRGELTFEECWKLQTELLEQNYKEEPSDNNGKNDVIIDVVDISDDDDPKVDDNTEVKKEDCGSVKTIHSSQQAHSKQEMFEPKCEIKVDESSIDNLLSVEKKYACNVCAFRAKEFHTLRVHTEMNHIQLRFHCKVCSWNTKERYPLKGHLRSQHEISLEDSDEHIIHECGICFFKGSKADFESHLRLFHSDFTHILMFSGRKKSRNKQKICDFCAKDYSGDKLSAAKLRSHIEISHMNARYKCAQCEFESGLKQAVYEHIEEKHLPMNVDKREKNAFKRNNTKFKCNVCALLTESHYTLLDHMKTEHLNELKMGSTRRRKRNARESTGNRIMHECPKCDYKSPIIQNLKIHIETHINSMFSCNICDVKNKRRSKIVGHIKKEHEVKLKLSYRGWCQRYVSCFCKDCNFLGSSQDYDVHLEIQHEVPKTIRKRREGKSSGEKQKWKISYKCGKCDQQYITRNSLKQHIAIKHLETVYSCDVCDDTFSKVIEIKEHMAADHPTQRDLVTTCCGECQTEAPNDLIYKHIMRVHRALYTRKYLEKNGAEKSKKTPKNGALMTYNLLDYNVKGQCYFCQSSIKKTETDSHILRVHMKATFFCKKCEDDKPTRHSLFIHIKKAHVDESVSFSEALHECQLYSCGLCEYKGEQLEFSKHVKEHEQEILQTKYSFKICNFCDFKHVSQRRLESHFAKIHDIEPFSCDVCSFKSKTKQGLLDHYKIIHPEYKYKCKLCSFESSHFAALWRHHQDLHEQSKYHKCKICWARFKRNEFLQHHLKKVHKL